MKALWDQLVSEVRRVNPKAVEALRPGAPPGQVLEKLSRLPYRISPDAAALYQWADGSDDKFEILPGAYLVSLDDALHEFWLLHPLRDEFDRCFHEPYRDCFRFLSDWSDGGFAFGRRDSPSGGRIVKLCIHAPWRVAFADLERLLVTAVECYRRGVFPPGDSDQPDFDLYYQLAGQLNPEMDWRTNVE